MEFKLLDEETKEYAIQHVRDVVENGNDEEKFEFVAYACDMIDFLNYKIALFGATLERKQILEFIRFEYLEYLKMMNPDIF